jgi:hypothetical protein
MSGLRILSYRRVKPDWHMIKSDFGVFFGYSAQQVAEKAVAKRRELELAEARRGRFLPLLEAQRR